MSASIVLPTFLQIGAGSSTNLSAIFSSLNIRKPLIITDKNMLRFGYTDKLCKALEQIDIQAAIFSDTMPEPTAASIEPAINLVRNNQYDSLIALGGGSAIDSAKAVAIVAKEGGKISDYKVPNLIKQKGLPLIAIPTTAGTGSECTAVTIITDEASDEKMLCMGPGLMPCAALIDYELTLSVPPRTTADTGIDALTHAIEAYVSKKANGFSDCQAVSAMKMIHSSLRTAYYQSDNAKARESMMLGASLAGMAFSNASVGLVHGMSRPIGAAFHVPHGLSNAILLPEVTRFSLSGAPERYSDCAKLMGIADANDSIKVAHEKLIDELITLNRELKVPSLAEFGVEKDTFFQLLPTMAEQALASGSPNNNPRVPNAQDIIELYERIWFAAE